MSSTYEPLCILSTSLAGMGSKAEDNTSVTGLLAWPGGKDEIIEVPHEVTGWAASSNDSEVPRAGVAIGKVVLAAGVKSGTDPNDAGGGRPGGIPSPSGVLERHRPWSMRVEREEEKKGGLEEERGKERERKKRRGETGKKRVRAMQ